MQEGAESNPQLSISALLRSLAKPKQQHNPYQNGGYMSQQPPQMMYQQPQPMMYQQPMYPQQQPMMYPQQQPIMYPQQQQQMLMYQQQQQMMYNQQQQQQQQQQPLMSGGQQSSQYGQQKPIPQTPYYDTEEYRDLLREYEELQRENGELTQEIAHIESLELEWKELTESQKLKIAKLENEGIDIGALDEKYELARKQLFHSKMRWIFGEWLNMKLKHQVSRASAYARPKAISNQSVGSAFNLFGGTSQRNDDDNKAEGRGRSTSSQSAFNIFGLKTNNNNHNNSNNSNNSNNNNNNSNTNNEEENGRGRSTSASTFTLFGGGGAKSSPQNDDEKDKAPPVVGTLKKRISIVMMKKPKIVEEEATGAGATGTAGAAGKNDDEIDLAQPISVPTKKVPELNRPGHKRTSGLAVSIEDEKSKKVVQKFTLESPPAVPVQTFESYLESLDAPPPLLSPIRSNIVVCVRCRPLSKREFEEKNFDIIHSNDGKSVSVDVRKATGADLDYLAAKRVNDKTFVFDRVYVGAKCQQEDVFKGVVGNVVDSVVDGENATVFAYGATGSGKTYTMLGTPENPGVIVHTMRRLFEELKNVKGASLEVSFLEVYCELIKDLLAPSSENQKPLEVRETKEGVVIPGLTSLPAKSADEVMQKLHDGNKKRTVRATNSNEVSSRSHAVFQVKVKRKFTTGVKVGTLSMIDLAGSERLKKSEVDGIGATEATRINQSLLALGNCITKLASGGPGAHVPYRDSKLTRLLEESLQGHCHTVMIAAISPSHLQVEETLNTLKYADRAKSIQTVVKKKVAKT